jgi:hypothetical protein
MDRLEDYIKNNRDDLDIYKPSPFLWRRITMGLKSDKRTASRWISVAASVAVLIATSVTFYHIGKGGKDSERNIISGRVSAGVSPELKEAEAYYNNRVNMLFLEAAPMLTANPDLKRELNFDISRIDSIYLEIRKDLKDNIANQEVVEALIQNYLIKIEILEEVLAILKDSENNTEKNRSHEL